MKREEVFQYCKNVGWIIDPIEGKVWSKTGILQCNYNKDGHIPTGVRIDGKMYYFYVHQIIYWDSTDEIVNNPVRIDHIDRDPSNNRSNNLKKVDGRENLLNSECWEKSKGYFWDKNNNNWRVRMKFYGKPEHYGNYSNEQDAIDIVRLVKEFNLTRDKNDPKYDWKS